LELAIFSSRNPLGPFEKIKSFSKKDLSKDGVDVISIEGTSLYFRNNCVELYISTEKDLPYPEQVKEFRKPGTGVWSIDCITADSIEGLAPENVEPVISEKRPEFLHVKDPFVYEASNGDTVMGYCTHPFSWSSSNSAAAVRKKDDSEFHKISDTILPRGHVWDVAATRVTDCLKIPNTLLSNDTPEISLIFYDGAECLRPHQQNTKGVKRVRGYSCEEIGGLACSQDDTFSGQVERLSVNQPFFVSPWGTGCSRYISTLVTDSEIIATWQQAQEDGSQPLVANKISFKKLADIIVE
jgi:hypothetical protein